MISMRSMSAAVIVMAACGASRAQSLPLSFTAARWIWSPSASRQDSELPAEVRYFRGELNLPRDCQITAAEVIATADNAFVLYVNGQSIGESGVGSAAWQSPQRLDITKAVVPGRNLFAVKAVNTLPGPAGLLLAAAARLADGSVVTLASDAAWKSASSEQSNWQHHAFEDGKWSAVRLVGNYGDAPWRNVPIPSTSRPTGQPTGEVDRVAAGLIAQATYRAETPVEERAPSADFAWPEGIVFLADDCSLYLGHGATNSSLDSLNVTIFNPRRSRAFPEHDLPSPMKIGRKLYALQPARPGIAPRLLLDAGQGAIGSPSVTFDGKSILFAMAREGDSFFHIYRISTSGGQLEQLTDGPFHDIDPAELPDGRIVFTSTRIGTFEEYHNPPARAIFAMDASGQDVHPLTNTLVFDNEPEVLADGRILFIRSDNFFGRGKVETLLHAIRPDGSGGQTEFGLDLGPEYGDRLRAYYCGSPAPLPDGRVAFLSQSGIKLGTPGTPERDLRQFSLLAGDVAALPDGRLLCTTVRGDAASMSAQAKHQPEYERIGILDLNVEPARLTPLFDSDEGDLHSPVYLGPRPRPPVLPRSVAAETVDNVDATGFLFCQNVRLSSNTTAGWPHVRAVRVLAAQGLTLRSSHSYIVHAGSEVTELGTVPLASDGSFHVEVPADTPISLQLVDAEGRSELNEMSWIFVRPGERRSCVGCHQAREAVPNRAGELAAALKTAPLKLVGQGDPHRYRGNNAAVNGLTELQFDRFREFAALNRHDDNPDPRACGSQDVTTLIERLNSADAGLKLSAVQRLSIHRDPIAAPKLAVLLHDGSREVRVAAALALASCGTRESIDPLLAALSTTDPLVAQAAAIAIENLTGMTERFDAFAPQRERTAQVERWKSWFADNRWEDIEAALIARLQSGDRDLARRAAVALGHTGQDAARNALHAYLLAHRDNNPFPAWQSAGHRGDAARFNSLSPVNPRTLQAVTRSLGYLRHTASVPDLKETLLRNSDPATANLFLAEAVAEALGRIPSPEAEAALVQAFNRLGPYPEYTRWYGDHDALIACHVSPLHYLIAEALDARESTQATSIIPHLIRSLPIDPDRALLLTNDDYEKLVGRVIRRNRAEAAVVETCLAILGDTHAARTPDVEEALATIYRCWAGEPSVENRAAQVLSLVCRDARYEERIRQAFLRYRQSRNEIPRVFDTGIPVVDRLPVKNWVCFYLARALGNLARPESAETLIATLQQEPSEAANGRPDPLGVGVIFLHSELTPCWRASVAWALGRIGDARAVPVLLETVANLDNATDTRHAAAVALGQISDSDSLDKVRTLASDYPEVSTRRALQRTIMAVGP